LTTSTRKATEPLLWAAPFATHCDQVVGQMNWAEKGKAIYFDSGVKGETHIYRVDVATGALKPLTSGPRNVHAAHVHDESGKIHDCAGLACNASDRGHAACWHGFEKMF
jgi:hypothetical protein